MTLVLRRVAALLCLSVVAACGGSDDASGTGATTTAATGAGGANAGGAGHAGGQSAGGANAGGANAGGAGAGGAGGATSAGGAGGAGGATSAGGAGAGGATSAGGSGGAGGALDPCQTLIDFETVPGGAPADNLVVATQFTATYGVTFGLDADLDGKADPGAAPVLAALGEPMTAFYYDTGAVGDTGAPGQDIGGFFLTDDGMVAGPPAALFIGYAAKVSAAYGEILDIDGDEAWTVDALDAQGAVLESVVITAGDADTGDGVATPWSFARNAFDIGAIRVRYSGANVGGVGLAFDNFSPACAAPTHQ